MYVTGVVVGSRNAAFHVMSQRNYPRWAKEWPQEVDKKRDGDSHHFTHRSRWRVHHPRVKISTKVWAARQAPLNTSVNWLSSEMEDWRQKSCTALQYPGPLFPQRPFGHEDQRNLCSMPARDNQILLNLVMLPCAFSHLLQTPNNPECTWTRRNCSKTAVGKKYTFLLPNSQSPPIRVWLADTCLSSPDIYTGTWTTQSKQWGEAGLTVTVSLNPTAGMFQQVIPGLVALFYQACSRLQHPG